MEKTKDKNKYLSNDKRRIETFFGNKESENLANKKTIINVKDLDLFYGDFQALKKINMEIKENEITAFIGPSGCGKSTTLKCFNRMNDLIDDCKIKGLIEIDGKDINKKNVYV
ncbi:MAG: ATP-binding cassette domain-containing protein, partial [Anaerococcus vaginalis]|nr:ATP-binding cassette domain-containing protein [Anaerococcus vaginalis]